MEIQEKKDILHGVLITICTLMCAFGAIANGLVIYFASKEPRTGAFHHLNKVVRDLAITDLLLCIVGAPLMMFYWTWSKFYFVYIKMRFIRKYLYNYKST